jgi:hypothetical protein
MLHWITSAKQIAPVGRFPDTHGCTPECDRFCLHAVCDVVVVFLGVKIGVKVLSISIRTQKAKK